jgi:hypothetical protein
MMGMLRVESGSDQEAKIIQDSGNGFAIANFIAANHLFDFAGRERFGRNPFIFFRLRLARS